MKEKSGFGKSVKVMLKAEGLKQKDLAERLGIGNGTLSDSLCATPNMGTMMRILDVLGYDIVFEKKTGMGSFRVKTGKEATMCDVCVYKEFSDDIEKALLKYQAGKEEEQKRNWYPDEDVENKET